MDELKRDIFGFRIYDHHEDPSQEMNDYDDSFDRFMFGNTKESVVQNERKPSNESGLLDQIDLGEVLHHVDTLMTSAKELKPLIGKVRPFLDLIMDKNKS
jgi:hypothetical protein